jgi:hypothetical protein
MLEVTGGSMATMVEVGDEGVQEWLRAVPPFSLPAVPVIIMH